MTALSPFLPGTNIQYAWDSTSLGYLKTCPRLYQYIMIEGWAGKDENIHLRFGQEFHKALEDYDKLLAVDIAPADALRQIVFDLLERTYDWKPNEELRAGKYKNRRTLTQLVIDYIDKYVDDAAKTFILQDGTPAVELSFRFELDWGPPVTYDQQMLGEGSVVGPQPYILCGHLDRVVDFQDSLFVMDRKTTMTTPGTYYFDQFEPNNQMTLYTLASQVVIHSPVKGVIIDAAQILLEKPHNFQRGMTYRTSDQLDEWTGDLRFWLTLAETYANANHWPMNDTACNNYGGCKFRGICSKSPGVRDKWLAGEFVQLPKEDRWNPLKPR